LKTEGGSPLASLRVLQAAGTAALVHQAQAASASQVALVVYLSSQSTAGPGGDGGAGGPGGVGVGGGAGGLGGLGGGGGGPPLQQVWQGPVQKKQQPLLVCFVAVGWSDGHCCFAHDLARQSAKGESASSSAAAVVAGATAEDASASVAAITAYTSTIFVIAYSCRCTQPKRGVYSAVARALIRTSSYVWRTLAFMHRL
jgi:hypothetical protein